LIRTQNDFVGKAGLRLLEHNGATLTHVNDLYHVFRVAGVVTHARDKEQSRIFFRGQGRHYGSLCPFLLRNVASSPTGNQEIDKRLKLFKRCHEKVASNRHFPRRFWGELGGALLQHYDVPTRWLDLTSNMFVAAYFASLNPRVQYEEKELGLIYCVSVNPLLELLTNRHKSHDDWEHCWCDLRKTINPLSMRPHTQHGVFLSRPEAVLSNGNIDFMGNVDAIIAFPTEKVSTILNMEQWRKLLLPEDHTFMWLNTKRNEDAEFKQVLEDLTNCH
jgi:hypothetical protein